MMILMIMMMMIYLCSLDDFSIVFVLSFNRNPTEGVFVFTDKSIRDCKPKSDKPLDKNHKRAFFCIIRVYPPFLLLHNVSDCQR